MACSGASEIWRALPPDKKIIIVLNRNRGSGFLRLDTNPVVTLYKSYVVLFEITFSIA